MTDTTTVDLAAWLTRIWDEEERRYGGHEEDCDEQFKRPCDCIYGVVLARIAADRKILEDAVDASETLGQIEAGEISADHEGRERAEWEAEILWRPVRHLASTHVDRPGFQEEWR
jgi:hypothetical protein